MPRYELVKNLITRLNTGRRNVYLCCDRKEGGLTSCFLSAFSTGVLSRVYHKNVDFQNKLSPICRALSLASREGITNEY